MTVYLIPKTDGSNVLMHHGILGQKWGVRRFQNKDGTLTEAGKKRYSERGLDKDGALTNEGKQNYSEELRYVIRSAKGDRHDKDSAVKKKLISDSRVKEFVKKNSDKFWKDELDYARAERDLEEETSTIGFDAKSATIKRGYNPKSKDFEQRKREVLLSELNKQWVKASNKIDRNNAQIQKLSEELLGKYSSESFNERMDTKRYITSQLYRILYEDK